MGEGAGGPDPSSGIVGRETELGRIDAVLAALPEGARGLILRGDPGIGKTTLWRHAIERCRSSGFQVLLARPSEEDMPLSAAGLADLFEHVEPRFGALDVADDPLTRGRAVMQTIRDLAERGPVVIGIDDVQWLDSVTSRALRYALRRFDQEPVGVLGTVRRSADVDPLALVSTLPPGRSQTLEIGPLGLPELRRVLDGVVDAISRPALRRIHEISGGNPLYAIELARELAGAPPDAAPSGELRLPDSLQAAIEGRLAGAPSEVTPLLEMVSALGRASVATLGQLLPAADRDRLLVSAVGHGLLVVEEDLETRFAHPLIGSAVYGRMNPIERRALHARLADLAVGPDARARHLALSVERADPDVAGLLEEAAGRERSRGGFDLAAELFHHSLRLTPPVQGEDVLRRSLGEIASRGAAGENGRAIMLADRLVATLPPGPARAEALIQRCTLETDGTEASEVFLRSALEDAGDDELLRGRVLDLLGRQRRYRGDLRGAIGFVRDALAIARRTGDGPLTMVSSGSLAYYEALTGTPRPALMAEALRLEEELGPSLLFAAPRLLHAKQLLWAGEIPSARGLLEGALVEAARAGNTVWREQALYDRALLECAAGDLATAEAYVRDGHQGTQDSEDPGFERLFLYPRALVDAWLGREAAARSTADRLLEMDKRQGEREGTARARGVLGLLALSEGNAEDARLQLAEAARLLDDIGVGNPGAYPILPDAVEACVRAGDLAEARTLLERLERQAASVDSTWAHAAVDRCRGLLLLAEGSTDPAASLLEASARRFEALGFVPDAARARLGHGRALLRGGKRLLAAEAFVGARDRFVAMGATLWAARVEEELDRVAPGRVAGELTQAERRVVGLVADGRRNREIAQELFMSVASVEAHLTRVYRKLDIRSRSELARLVAQGSVRLEVLDEAAQP